MNLFKVLASGNRRFYEDQLSAVLAYLCSPRMDHGLGYQFVSRLTEKIESNLNISGLSDGLEDRLRDSLGGENESEIKVTLETPFSTNNNSSGRVDLVLQFSRWTLLVENKLYLDSQDKGQIGKEYSGMVKQREDLKLGNIICAYLVPGISDGKESWSVNNKARIELDQLDMIEDEKYSDKKILLYWQPVRENEMEVGSNTYISIYEILKELLDDELNFKINPLSYDVKNLILSLGSFILDDFKGYPYQKPIKNEEGLQYLNAKDFLPSNENQFVGIRYGQAGLINLAWRDQHFYEGQLFPVVNSTHYRASNWQYLPVRIFKIFSEWAMNPEGGIDGEIEWKGKPFGAKNLYRIAKYGDVSNLCIGIKGGLTSLYNMDVDEIIKRAGWEIGTRIKSENTWFSLDEFKKCLDEKGISFE